MKLAQSFWTKPSKNNLFDIKDRLSKDLYIIALSCWYAKNSRANLTMYTDEIGIQLLDHLPYDNINEKLKDIPKSIPDKIWAYSKFFILPDLELSTVHIDNDVYIKSETCLDALAFDDYDCIVQSEDSVLDIKAYADTKEYFKHILSPLGYNDVLNETYEFNTGVIGFNNYELKDKYTQFYIKCVDDMIKYCNAKFDDTLYTYCPDILIEQLSLHNLSKGYNVKKLLKPFINKQEQALNIGYQHLLANAKYDSIDKTKQLLKYHAPDLYNKTEAKIEKYLK